MRARLPNGRAMWPAFWLVPTDGPTPPELDIVEVVGSDPSHAYMTVHWDYTKPKTGNASCKLPLPDIDGRFYTYGALWTPTLTTFYIDRKPVALVRTPASMNVRMYMLVNLAVGGRWPGYVDERVAQRASMEIDWIAAYQLDSEGLGGTETK
jgi:beta-glucanase (GH16 family)